MPPIRTSIVSEPAELLAAGVGRFLPGAEYQVPPEGYARILAEGPLRAPGEPLICLDLESLGFLGRPLFLVGALFVGAGPDPGPGPDPGSGAGTDPGPADQAGPADAAPPAAGVAPAAKPAPSAGPRGRTRLVQYLARDYSEEEAVVRAFAREAGEEATWVTFNGRTFDVPLLRLRASYHRVAPPRMRRHIDLLPVARRLWGGRLPNCRLQTLERHICGRRPRVDDIPGAEIPRAYHDFVRTGEPGEMLRILEHNAGDLFSLYQLLQAARASGFDEGAEPR